MSLGSTYSLLKSLSFVENTKKESKVLAVNQIQYMEKKVREHRDEILKAFEKGPKTYKTNEGI